MEKSKYIYILNLYKKENNFTRLIYRLIKARENYHTLNDEEIDLTYANIYNLSSKITGEYKKIQEANKEESEKLEKEFKNKIDIALKDIERHGYIEKYLSKYYNGLGRLINQKYRYKSLK